VYNLIRRKVFVSYHHGGDQAYYDEFSRMFSDRYELIYDHSLERKVGSEDPEYVMRRIREKYLTGASVTVVLCGRETPWRKYVDWEICASLNQQMGIVGVKLPTITPGTNGSVIVPDRLHHNIESGYAIWTEWNQVYNDPAFLLLKIEEAYEKSVRLIDNSHPTMQKNGSYPY
jgi:hypothetical protein